MRTQTLIPHQFETDSRADINFLTLLMTVEAAVETAVVAEGGEVHQQYQARQRRPLEVRNRRQPEVGGFPWEMSLTPPQEGAIRR